MASLFMGVNRNKRSIVLDLKTAPARERTAAAGRSGRCVRAQHPAAEARAAGPRAGHV
jgi:crotonobetainyl-CoA:carnitine CoA-transferase CaiB-like acyl-CoA transferase